MQDVRSSLCLPLLNRVYCASLDPSKCWWALNTRICGQPPRKFSTRAFSQKFPSALAKIKADEALDKNGAQIDIRLFDGGGQRGGNKKEEVYVGTTLCVLGCLLRQDPQNSPLFLDTAVKDILVTVDTIDLLGPARSLQHSSSVRLETEDTVQLRIYLENLRGELSHLRRVNEELAKDLELARQQFPPFCNPSSPPPDQDGPMFFSTPKHRDVEPLSKKMKMDATGEIAEAIIPTVHAFQTGC